LAFNISGGTLSANSSDGNGNTNSVAITWQSAWSLADTEFRIKWEAGLAHFYVGGVQQAVICDISVPGDPMSLYLSNGNPDTIYLKYIDAKGIQSFSMNTPISGSQSFGRIALVGDSLAISESLTVLRAILVQNLITDTLTITESVSMGYGAGLIPGKSVSDVLTISETVSIVKT
jgi:hypothetical protein